MGLSRRFQNLILDNHYAGTKWLLSMDLTRQLFGDTPPPTTIIGQGSESALLQESTSHTPAAANSSKPKKNLAAAVAAALNMERIRLPSPILRFNATYMPDQRFVDCFPLSDRRVVMADHTGRMFLYNVDSRRVMTLPNLHEPKYKPISLFVPNDDPSSGGGSLYVMESCPKWENGNCTQLSDQFEAFVCGYGKPTRNSEGPWHSQLLPPPPFVRDPACWCTHLKITSYAVVGSDICISTEVNGTYNGTYCLDTASNTWLQVGKETPLPSFYGRAEYVPELKLWFGLSTDRSHHLVAADLSSNMMDSQPQLIGNWKEFDTPEGWHESYYPQLVKLGSGRFCIARLFHTLSMDLEETLDRMVVFTGVEVMQVGHDGDGSGSGNGRVKLQMKKHKSRCSWSHSAVIRSIF